MQILIGPVVANDWGRSHVGGRGRRENWKGISGPEHVGLLNIPQRGLYFMECWKATEGLSALELNDRFTLPKDHSVQRLCQFLTGGEPARGEG